MKNRDAERHPGPWRVMRVDAESAGILVAIAFVVLGIIGLPIGGLFLTGAVVLGIAVALLFRWFRKG